MVKYNADGYFTHTKGDIHIYFFTKGDCLTHTKIAMCMTWGNMQEKVSISNGMKRAHRLSIHKHMQKDHTTNRYIL